MPYTLLFPITAPYQAWGAGTFNNDYTTNDYPTKSGVIGLVCNALGKDYNEDISPYSSLSFGVRVDFPGMHAVLPEQENADFHIIHFSAEKKKPSLKKPDPTKDFTATLTKREYIENGIFLCALQSENRALLEEIRSALNNPARQLYLGRKEFLPDPISFNGEIKEGKIVDLFETEEDLCSRYPSLLSGRMKKSLDKIPVTIVHEDRLVKGNRKGSRKRIYDHPLTFGFHDDHTRLREHYAYTIPRSGITPAKKPKNKPVQSSDSSFYDDYSMFLNAFADDNPAAQKGGTA